MAETFAFQAEINQLLSLIINTFYSNKDVFLRELISNASDALDKIRYASLTDASVLGSENTLDIKITPDKDNKTLIIQDSGIGMNKDDLIKNLGTIAHSGTRAFMESLQAGTADVNLIGQFGVGFYSAYLVAKEVTVISKKHDADTAYIWKSNASGSFSVDTYTGDDVPQRGTKIILSIKDDQTQYLEEQKIRDIIRCHSQYCSFPIKLYVIREEEIEVDEEPTPTPITSPKENKESNDDSSEETNGEPTSDVKIEEENTSDTDDDGEITEDIPKERKKQKVTKPDWDTLNTQAPIWTRKPEDVTPDEYTSFYKSISGDWEDHLAVKHFSVDGSVQFKAILFIPKRPPFDMFMTKKKAGNIKLYVRKVLIMEDSTELLPECLSFVKGIVDSDDLPLNVSREMLQQNNVMRVIQKNLIKKTIEMMNELDADKFKTFYEGFAKNIKYAVHEDSKNRDKLVQLLRFNSSKTDDSEMTSLKDYVTRMKEGQKNIYYVAGENLAMCKNSPFIEKLKTKGYEVLYMTDAIDEYMTQSFKEYDGKKLVDCSRDGIEIEESDKEAHERLVKEWEPVTKKIKEILDDKVTRVTVSNRIVDSPCVLVSEAYGWTANMERIMKAQALRNDMYGMMNSRKIMEINPDHAIMKEIKTRVMEDNIKNIKVIIDMLYDTVVIDSGFSLTDPSRYARKIYKLIQTGLQGEEQEEQNNDTRSHQDTSRTPEGISTNDVSTNDVSTDESKMEEVD